jgi:hypothetical protein
VQDYFKTAWSYSLLITFIGSKISPKVVQLYCAGRLLVVARMFVNGYIVFLRTPEEGMRIILAAYRAGVMVEDEPEIASVLKI